jgi:diguanylate cyclase (GGDEF)-like protein
MGEKPKRVLLVEDDAQTIRMVQECLSESCCEVVEATCLSDALEHLAEDDFDAVVTDLSLPDSRGPETFRIIEEKHPDVAIVVLTGSYDESLGIEAMQQGAQDFLLKDQIDPVLLRRSLLYAIERQKVRKELLSLALRDPLTGLYNRRGLAALAEHQLALGRREGRAIVAVSVDIDAFKEINDAHGHDAGDRVLVRVADVLRRTFRAPDVLARIGGDEFVVIATTEHPEAIPLIAARLRAHLRTANHSARRPDDIAVSIGVSALDPLVATSLNDVLNAADRAMYDDKRWRRGHDLRVTEHPAPAGSRRLHRSRATKARRKSS